MLEYILEKYEDVKISIEELQESLTGHSEDIDKIYNLSNKQLELLDEIYTIITNKIIELKG